MRSPFILQKPRFETAQFEESFPKTAYIESILRIYK